MKTTETITTRSGLQLLVETGGNGDEVEVSLKAPADKRCLLHWGVRRQYEKDWKMPPQSSWPPGTVPSGQSAVETPFAKQNGQTSLAIRLGPPSAYAFLDFVLFFPDEGRWDNNGGRNYQIILRKPAELAVAPLALLREQIGAEASLLERVFDLDGIGQLAIAVAKAENRYRVLFVTNIGEPLILHWGMARRSPHEWLLPPESVRGAGTIIYQELAAETPFVRHKGLNKLHLEFPEPEAPLGIQFVLRQGEQGGRWLKYRGGNFYLPVQERQPAAATLDVGQFGDLAEDIVRAETTHNSWTLMHRFNLCYELVERVRNNLEGQALLYVWMRFSAIRQLTWQRNYNTKPSELAHAQDRLGGRLADLYRNERQGRPI